jgi:hypothetical protein
VRHGLIPAWLSSQDGSLRIHWADLGLEPCREPFLWQTIQRRVATEEDLVTTSIAALDPHVGDPPAIPPSGFIFHVSRCGSTLVTQMLAALDRVVMLSEPAVLHQLLFAAEAGLPVADRARLLCRLVRALGRPRGEGDTVLVIKFASLDTLHLSLIRRVFPEVPLIFLHRDPVEVLISSLEASSGWLQAKRLGNPLLLSGFSAAELQAMPDEQYALRVLAAFYRSVLHEPLLQTRVVDYSRLPEAVLDEVAPWFGIEVTSEERLRILEVSRLYSKDPARARFFVPDADRKRAAASSHLRELAEEWLGGLRAEVARLG